MGIFDVDGSGTIDSKELEGLIQMIIPNPHPMLVQEMVTELDTNKDGEVDLWEFCVHMQKRTEGITTSDLKMELDAAFQLIQEDADGNVDEAEIKRMMQDPHTGAALTDAELNEFLDDLETRGMGVRGGKKISLRALRLHPCYQA